MGENIYIVIDIVKRVHLPASRNELARMYVILNNDAVAIHQEVFGDGSPSRSAGCCSLWRICSLYLLNA